MSITYALWLQELKNPLITRAESGKRVDRPLITWTINFCDAIYRPVVKKYKAEQLELLHNRWYGMSCRMTADRGIIYHNYRL